MRIASFHLLIYVSSIVLEGTVFLRARSVLLGFRGNQGKKNRILFLYPMQIQLFPLPAASWRFISYQPVKIGYRTEKCKFLL